jgi:hypothetical protein
MAEQKRVPDWLLECFAQGEHQEIVAPSEALQALHTSNVEILTHYPAPQMAREIKRRASLHNAKQGSPSWTITLLPAFAALALAVWIGRGYLSPESPIRDNSLPMIEDTLPKGLSPKLQLYRKNGELAERLEPNSKVRARDLVQISYNAAGKGFGVVISIDGRGVVTRHLPEEGAIASKLSATGEVALPSAYELDDAPRFEYFYFITGEAPFAVDAVINAAKAVSQNIERAGKPLQLPKGLTQSWIMLQKEPT